ncbi:MAG: hypothetical protein WBA00_10570 [Rhodococcus sp. (in: high G+C Gram-positive bacteria)]
MNKVRRSATLAAVSTIGVVSMLLGSGVANADEWPPVPAQPSASGPFETNSFLTPTDLDYYNPFVENNRLTSPFGTSTRIVCTGFHGVLSQCWQADGNGNPHRLIRLPYNVPNISGSFLPGGGSSHFVYPFF